MFEFWSRECIWLEVYCLTDIIHRYEVGKKKRDFSKLSVLDLVYRVIFVCVWSTANNLQAVPSLNLYSLMQWTRRYLVWAVIFFVVRCKPREFVWNCVWMEFSAAKYSKWLNNFLSMIQPRVYYLYDYFQEGREDVQGEAKFGRPSVSLMKVLKELRKLCLILVESPLIKYYSLFVCCRRWQNKLT